MNSPETTAIQYLPETPRKQSYLQRFSPIAQAN
jgi:hypothetical protein